jgi:hypothetical protein
MLTAGRRQLHLLLILVIATAVVIGGLAIGPFTAGAITYSNPLTITKGGTYTGSWESNDARIPAVTVATTEPVVIQDCNLRGKGNLVHGRVGTAVDVTVRNCVGENTSTSGRFIELDGGFRRGVIQNNDLNNTGGMWFNSATPTELLIQGNQGRNVKGLDDGFSTFIQLSGVTGANIDISWNEVINSPDASQVQDNINLFNSGGTDSSHPVKVHDNFIWGAFPVPATTVKDYAGGGIMVGDRGSAKGKYVVVENNQVVGTTNYGIAIVCGSNQIVRNNTVIASGRTADGTWLAGMNVGLSFISESTWGAACTTFKNNSMTGNDVAWLRGPNTRWAAGRSDVYTPATSNDPTYYQGGNTASNNVSRPSVSYADEKAEHTKWLTKTAGRQIGAGTTSGPTMVPTTTAAPTTTSTTATPTTTSPSTTAPTTTTPPTTAAPTTTAPSTTTTTNPPSRPSGQTSTGPSRYSVALGWLTPTDAVNGLGPVERNKSNGGAASGDGRTLTLNGTRYRRGLGVHAASRLTYDLDGRYDRFSSWVGLDDQSSSGSVRFEVWVDGERVYLSPTKRASSASSFVSVDVDGAQTIELVVTDAGDGTTGDLADWAEARLHR